MNRNLFSVLLFGAILFFPFSSASATTESGSGYNTPTYIDMNFEAELVDGDVVMSWDKYAPAGFTYYKVIRSATNENPVYPDDGYITFSTDPNFLTYTDTELPSGKLYYRVCSIVSPDRFCSEVVEIERGGVDDTDDDSAEDLIIVLEISEEDGSLFLSWEADGDFPLGFKIAKSKTHEAPTYPVMEGDEYVYLSEPSVREYLDADVAQGETYHYRVCKYLDGVCGTYSNAVSVTVEGDNGEDGDNGDDGDSDESDVTAITLSIRESNGKASLSWMVEGDSPLGYKVTKSTTHENPTYPVMEGDDYIYLSDEEARSYLDGDVEQGETYYYRVCDYLGAECGVYSNPVSLGITGEQSEGDGFPDTGGHRYEDGIKYVQAEGIVNGYPSGLFEPEWKMNRAEFVKVLIEAAYPHEASGSFCFPDVNDEWFAPFVCYAKEKGIVAGNGNGLFEPESEINFAEAAKIFTKVLLGMSPGEDGATWYEKYIDSLMDKGVVPETVDSADDILTRAEIVEMIYRIKTLE